MATKERWVCGTVELLICVDRADWKREALDHTNFVKQARTEWIPHLQVQDMKTQQSGEVTWGKLITVIFPTNSGVSPHAAKSWTGFAACRNRAGAWQSAGELGVFAPAPFVAAAETSGGTYFAGKRGLPQGNLAGY
ncbi:MAG: hypothetical protein WBP85_01590 [Terracidiphilus sp.]